MEVWVSGGWLAVILTLGYCSKCHPTHTHTHTSPNLTYWLWIGDIKLAFRTLRTLVCSILKSVVLLCQNHRSVFMECRSRWDEFLGVFFIMSVCLSTWNNSAATGWIFIKFDARDIPNICCENLIFYVYIYIYIYIYIYLTRITGFLREDHCMFMMSLWIHLRMKSVSDRSYRDN
jgi:hypothetical protein